MWEGHSLRQHQPLVRALARPRGLWERAGSLSCCVGVGLRPSNSSHIISKPWVSPE